MVELLRARAAEQPDERAYVFLSDRGGEEASLTFSELERRASALAAQLVGRGSARRARAPDVPAWARFHRRLLRLPHRRHDRGADDAAPAPRGARFERQHCRRLHAAVRFDESDSAGGAKRSRGASQGDGARFHLRRRHERGRGACGKHFPRARPAGSGFPAIHLGLDVGSQGRDGEPRQPSRQFRDDPARVRQHARDHLCELGPALSRYGAYPERAADALCRLPLRAHGAGELHAAPVDLAARHQRLPRRVRNGAELCLRSLRRSLPPRPDGGDRSVGLENCAQRRRARARGNDGALHPRPSRPMASIRRRAPRPMDSRRRRCSPPAADGDGGSSRAG